MWEACRKTNWEKCRECGSGVGKCARHVGEMCRGRGKYGRVVCEGCGKSGKRVEAMREKNLGDGKMWDMCVGDVEKLGGIWEKICGRQGNMGEMWEGYRKSGKDVGKYERDVRKVWENVWN